MIIQPSEKTPVASDQNDQHIAGPSNGLPRAYTTEDIPPPYSSGLQLVVPGATRGSLSVPPSPTFGTPKKPSTGSAKPSDLLNPPPPSFTRAINNALSFAPFPPCVLRSLTTQLDGGWPLVAPSSAAQPHPFASHDVQEEDWTRFLGDTKRAGKLSPMNQVVANVIPMAMGLPIFGGVLMTFGIQKRMKRKKVGPVTELLEYWNHYFFRPRGIEITLVQGDPAHVLLPQGTHLARRPSSISSCSSSDEDHRHHNGAPMFGRDDRCARHGARRAERRERKAERREGKRAARAQQRGNWHLVLTYTPPQREQYAPSAGSSSQGSLYASPQPSPYTSPQPNPYTSPQPNSYTPHTLGANGASGYPPPSGPPPMNAWDCSPADPKSGFQ